MRNNAVFREDKLHLSAFFCEKNARDGTCVKYAARIYRLPAGFSADGNSVHAAGPGAVGFLDYLVRSQSGDKLSLENTMIEVTQDRDMVLCFEAVGLESDHRQPAGIKYAIFYQNKGRHQGERHDPPSAKLESACAAANFESHRPDWSFGSAP